MTPDPEARRRALQLLASQVGPGTAMPFQPVDLAALAPVPDMDTEGLRTERFAGQMEAPSEDELLRREEAGLRTRAAVGNIAADLGQSTSRAIETITGAPGSKVYEGMRERTSEPLKAFLRAQELKARGQVAKAAVPLKPAMTDDQARASIRALYPDASEEAVNATTALNYEATRKSLEGTAGRGERSGRFTEGMEARKREAEARAEAMARREGLEWAKMDQQERLARMRIEESRIAREQKATESATTRGLKLAERNVGGFEINPQDPPSADASKKMADAAIARDEIVGSLDILEGMYSRLGSEQVGEESGTMGSEWMNITNRLRTLNEMGVPNGADYAMLGKQIEDPTTFQAITTSKSRGLAQMRALRDQIRRKMDATAKALKYRPAGAKTQAPSQPLQRVPAATALPKTVSGQPTIAPDGDMVRIILNGKPKDVPRANLEKVKALAKQKGYTLELPNG